MKKESLRLPQLQLTINPSPDDKIVTLVQIETNCRRHFKEHLERKTSAI